MRRSIIAALAFCLATAPMAAWAEGGQTPAPTATAPAAVAAEAKPFDYYPIVVGLGAIAGVVGFNLIALGVEAVPGGLAYGAPGATVAAEASVAISRVWAITSAVTGGLIAYYVFAP